MILPYLLLLLPAASRSLEAQNGSMVELHCKPAELFVRSHMAPDFESPQLIRRLDWFHDDNPIASFVQSTTGDATRQWWVEGSAMELIRPFFSLRIHSILPEDAGSYRCRLETDPLFSLTHSTAAINLTVFVRPVTPSMPEIRAVTNSSVTLSWSHPTAKAHRPILRYSVLVRSVGEGSEFIIPAPSNATSVIVDNLSPHTLYAFSVRAENAAGTSEFGGERVETTKGQAPSSPPLVASSTCTDDCIRLLLRPPSLLNGRLTGYRLRVSALNNSSSLEHNTTSLAHSEWVQVCSLEAFTTYSVSVEAANAFGYSPSTTVELTTDQGVPDAPPSVRLRPLIGQPAVVVHWETPNVSRGLLTHFSIHFIPEGVKKGVWKTEHLHISSSNAQSHSHKYQLNDLEPSTSYAVRVSAATVRGEGNSSAMSRVTTDVPVPKAVDITNLSIDCSYPKVRVEWKRSPEAYLYQLLLKNASYEVHYNTTQNTVDLVDLLYQEEYTAQLITLARSSLNHSVLLSSLSSPAHAFLLKDGCVLHSSLCTSSVYCQPLQSSTPSGRLALLFILSLVFLFLLFSSSIALLIRHKCFHLKKLMKKREKSLFLDELSPLVYDGEGCEDVPVELFYGMCEDFAKDDNLKYRMLFERINDLTEGEGCDGSTPSEGDPVKDRYQNVVATEATRIRIQDDNGSDYINANFIDSCETRHAYIATQAPLPHTFGDFWSMCWQERVNVIVVITNLVEDGRRKCDQYWPPSISQPQQHGNFVVTLLSQATNAHFVHRILSLRISKSLPPTERRVHHVHFTGWPDHGVPQSVFPLLSFMHFVAQIHSTGPILIHCSAGVGRSGSFILIDSMRRRLLKHRTLNLAGHLLHMRKQREKLVQTLEQFIFCHEVVRQLARHGITRVPAALFPRYVQYLAEENLNGKQRLDQQWKDICGCCHQPRCSPLTQQPVVLPGFHRLEEFLVGHWSSECRSLWQSVWENDCQGVLVLAEDEGVDNFWTREEHHFDGVSVHHTDGHVVLSGHGESVSVCLLRLSPSAMDTSTWSELERVQTQRGPSHDSPLLLVCPATATPPPPALIPPATHSLNTLSRRQRLMCSTGLSRPFAFCALTSLACQLEQHGALDVIQTLSAYTNAHCGAFYDRHAIEYIYERLLQLVNMNKS